MRSLIRRTTITLAALALAALGPQALAYYSCSWTITVYSSGGQTCNRTCRFYSDDTGQYLGSMSMEFQC